MGAQMSDQPDHLSRRNMLLGLGAAAGAGIGIGITGLPGAVGAAPVGSPFAPIRRPEALSPNVAGLVYQNIDAQAFWPEFGMAAGNPATAQRVYADATGSQPGAVNTRIWAPLPIPVGSIIFQISAAYQGQPIIEISKRTLFSTGV